MDFPIHCQNTLSKIETFPRWCLIATVWWTYKIDGATFQNPTGLHPCHANVPIHAGHFWSNYFISAIFWKIFEKFAAIKSLLNPHFKGFGAITRSGFCWSCFSDHFGMVDVPFRPMNDHFVTIFVFFAIFLGGRALFLFLSSIAFV